jgi:hypothetical protein
LAVSVQLGTAADFRHHWVGGTTVPPLPAGCGEFS